MPLREDHIQPGLMKMRNVYLFCAALISLDVLVFWLLKQIGVLSNSKMLPGWVKIVFLAPIDMAILICLIMTIHCVKVGVIYSSMGGSEILFSEEPLRFIFNVITQILTFSVILIFMTAIVIKGI